MAAARTPDPVARAYATLHLQRGMRLLRRRSVSSAGLTLGCALVVFIIYVALTINAHAHASAQKVASLTQVTATLAAGRQGTPAVPLSQAASETRGIPGVTAVRTLTQQQAQQEFARQAPEAYSGEPASLFRAAVIVQVARPSLLASVASRLRSVPGVEQATYPLALARQATAVSGWLRTVAKIIAVLGAICLIGGLIALVRSAVAAEHGTLETIRGVGAGMAALAIPVMVQIAVIVLVAATAASAAGYILDPVVGTGQSGLPDWLRTGRAYGLLGLWPLLTLGVLACAETLALFTVRRAVRDGARPAGAR